MNFDLERQQINAYRALCEIDSIFQRHNIKYFTLAGTVLGAVRHGGFIPWDDDIDIGVLLKDYKRAGEILEKELTINFKWTDRYVEKDYPRLFGKVTCNGIGCVDLFPLVKTSNNPLKRRIQWINRKVLFKLYKAKLGYSNGNENKNMYARIKVFLAGILAKNISMQFLDTRIEANEKRFEYLQHYKYYLNLYSAYSLKKEMIRKEWLDGNAFLSFGQGIFSSVSNPGAYLTHLYGNYMALPPEDKRIRRHDEIF